MEERGLTIILIRAGWWGVLQISTRAGWMSRIFLLDGLGILVEMHHSAGWRPRLFLLDGYRGKLQKICLGWVEDKILPDGWM